MVLRDPNICLENGLGANSIKYFEAFDKWIPTPFQTNDRGWGEGSAECGKPKSKGLALTGKRWFLPGG